MVLTFGFDLWELRFRAKLLAEKLRNKRLMFVGDSLNRNQWESMVCLVQSVADPGRKSLIKTGSLSIFRLEVCSLSFRLSSKSRSDALLTKFTCLRGFLIVKLSNSFIKRVMFKLDLGRFKG